MISALTRARVRELNLRDIQPVVIYTLLRNGGPVQRIKRENPITQVYSQQERKSDRFSQIRSRCVNYVKFQAIHTLKEPLSKRNLPKRNPKNKLAFRPGSTTKP